jgi:hypothetical protein
MLSVGPRAPRFSPSQNIRMIRSEPPTVMYITDNIPLTHLELRLLDPDMTVRFAHRSFGDTFIVIPKDTPRDKEGRQ